jgi:hypothetical protein
MTKPAETYMGPPCIHGHDGRRYASNGHCVECTNRYALARYRQIKEGKKPRPPLRTGTFYQGKPCRHGHDGLRYSSSAGCVTCTNRRALARSQRTKKEGA